MSRSAIQRISVPLGTWDAPDVTAAVDDRKSAWLPISQRRRRPLWTPTMWELTADHGSLWQEQKESACVRRAEARKCSPRTCVHFAYTCTHTQWRWRADVTLLLLSSVFSYPFLPHSLLRITNAGTVFDCVGPVGHWKGPGPPWIHGNILNVRIPAAVRMYLLHD